MILLVFDSWPDIVLTCIYLFYSRCLTPSSVWKSRRWIMMERTLNRTGKRGKKWCRKCLEGSARWGPRTASCCLEGICDMLKHIMCSMFVKKCIFKSYWKVLVCIPCVQKERSMILQSLMLNRSILLGCEESIYYYK